MITVLLQKRADGMPDQRVEAERIQVEIIETSMQEQADVTIEFDPDSGDDGEYRVIVDDDCVWSMLVVPSEPNFDVAEDEMTRTEGGDLH
jgi:hypothetical protein